MRASKAVVRGQPSAVSRRDSRQEIHISGAEGLYGFSDIEKIAGAYFLRAMSHPKGRPDKVVITVEEIKEKPRIVGCLPFSTVPCNSTGEARKVVMRLLSDSGVSRKAILNAFRLVSGHAAMNGGAVMRSGSARRMEPDKKRGIRVSRLGIRKDAERTLTIKLARKGINTTTVKEAIVLASKVASCRGVIAEFCVSDDPDYTTGYVASRELGYVRILHLKKKRSVSGGRVFFIDEGVDAGGVIEYLERKPVLVGK